MSLSEKIFMGICRYGLVGQECPQLNFTGRAWECKENICDKALDILRREFNDQPDSPSCNWQLGNALFIRKNYAKALDRFLKVEEFHIKINDMEFLPRDWRFIGICLFETGKLDDAAKYLKKASEYFPEDTEINLRFNNRNK